ncbi:unnamed protein product [Blepharisma stoltei]|uniref:Uncharacterized protein n=1 Tax=Blepharisma stoltei TaxID=1481888 RepID=A0AAU9JVV8_9CILI|nr:unnamed protein product [Blepharisma stoltei]
METKTVIDPTLNHSMKGRNTFNTIFPQYSPRVKEFTTTIDSSFHETVDFSNESGFVLHNKDLLDKEHHKKVDRHVIYREEMLKVKNMRAKKQ